MKMAGGMLIQRPLTINPAGRLSMAISTGLTQMVTHSPAGRRLPGVGITLNPEPVMIWSVRCMYPIRRERSILESFGISEIVLNLFGKVTDCPG